jgi:ATP-dependent DNA helicase DinG
MRRSRRHAESLANAVAAAAADQAALRSSQLATIFAETGTLASAIPGYRPRAAQEKMSEAVANAIADNDTVIVEAGTGTGKTYAYLVPAMLWGGRSSFRPVPRTQDQLYLRDIPTVRHALNVPISVSLLKGRANYVCHYHLERAQANGRLASKQDAAWLREISRFAKTTTSGDKAELAEVPENAPVWQIVTSTRDNCLGSECPNYKECFVMRARKEAQQADLVVVNHHLFFADVVLRDTGMAELLPAANTVIFDEAHQLPETATLFFGETLSTSQLLELARDTVAEGLSHARDAVDWVALGAPLERAARDLRLAFGRRTPALRWGRSTPTRAFASRFTKRSTRSTRRCPTLSRHWNRRPSVPRSLNSAIAARSNSPSGWRHGATTGLPHPRACGRAGRRCGRRPETVLQTSQPVQPAQLGPETVRWVEVFSHTVQLHRTPLSIAPIFSRQRAGQPRAWVFTSATLSVKGNFTHYAAQLGLDRDRSLTLPSPFDYAKQGLLYVPGICHRRNRLNLPRRWWSGRCR